MSSKQSERDAIDEIPLTMLKNAFYLAEKLNQTSSQLRRNFIKSLLPIQYATLGDKGHDLFEHLVGDSIRNALKSLQNENKMKALLKKRPDLLRKRKHSASLKQSPNYKISSTTQNRTQYHGHSAKKSNDIRPTRTTTRAKCVTGKATPRRKTTTKTSTGNLK